MELRHLRYFVAVAEELHFRRAAERLNMSQPPLSLQIRELEQELGTALFHRTRQAVTLTAAGHALLRDARDLLQGAAAAARHARNAGNGESGELRIGLTQSAEFLSYLPEAVHRLRSSHPGVTVSLRQMTTAEQVDTVASRRLDLGISRQPVARLPRDVQLVRLSADPLVLAVHADDPLAGQGAVWMHQLRERPFVISPASANSGLHEATIAMARAARFFPSVAQEVRQITSTVAMVAAGAGVAVVPASARCIRIGSVVLVPISDSGAQSWLHMILPAAPPNPVLAELMGLLRDAAQAEAA